ncbi:hypothetical protein PACILC2_35020 [Paenibacillus cisolokensis]|uniref:Penicillinase repressor n=1 Tax=Paenibacillus cisolokensis TaxID=1658519 RepID=A0ABQ4N9M6_9BACL|nr:hypothetical protein PACILC2_35020 [Paenibacillus cisolokensis]
MKQIPKISDAEWEVMKVFWAKAPLTANDVIQALEGSKDWNPKTIRTLIKRLVEKTPSVINRKAATIPIFRSFKKRNACDPKRGRF